jgi:hypothetical protein
MWRPTRAIPATQRIRVQSQAEKKLARLHLNQYLGIVVHGC